jgi:GTP cyclohydrolase I
MFTEICWGLSVDENRLMETSFEEDTYGGIVAVTNIGFTSLCKHHFAIFRGIAHVGYIPEGRLIGLSKINRLVEAIAARPQVQEHITYQIAETIDKTLSPKGVAVLLEGSHDCIEVRGVKSKGSITKTSEMRGCFLENAKNCKEEFFEMVKGK